MSIASAIQTKQQQVADAYTACNGKGATMPATQNLTNLATCIDSIQGGGSFVGLNREVVNGKYSMPITSFTFSLPNDATDLNQYTIRYAFVDCTGLTTVDLSNLTSVSGAYAMRNAFYNSRNLTSVDLSSLTTVSGAYAMYNVCQGCTGLTTVDLSSLTTVSGRNSMQSAFQDCTKLTTLSFPSLISTGFGSYTNQFDNMLSGVTGCTVHFPSNLQSKIGSWSSVTSGFGGTNTTVLFDLPATT